MKRLQELRGTIQVLFQVKYQLLVSTADLNRLDNMDVINELVDIRLALEFPPGSHCATPMYFILVDDTIECTTI